MQFRDRSLSPLPLSAGFFPKRLDARIFLWAMPLYGLIFFKFLQSFIKYCWCYAIIYVIYAYIKYFWKIYIWSSGSCKNIRAGLILKNFWLDARIFYKSLTIADSGSTVRNKGFSKKARCHYIFIGYTLIRSYLYIFERFERVYKL